MIIFIRKVRVVSRNFVSDFGANIINIIGGRLKTYEEMIKEGIDETVLELQKENTEVRNIKLQVTEFSNSSIAIIAYGEIEC